MILNFDRGHGQNSEQMVQSLMESTQLAFDTLERKLGLSGGSLIDDDGNVVTVTKLVNKSTDKIEANYLAIKGELYASEARIVDLEAANVTINDTLKAHDANIDNLETNKADISTLNAESARIDTLEANSVTTETLNAEKARIDALETSKANIDDLNAEKARIDNLETNKADISTLNAEKARIDSLETGKADISSLTAESARIDNLEANKADITSLNAEIARIDNLESTKADIDLANVNNAWIANGVIKDASIANEKVISVSANKLTAGTIDASKITVTNLNADNITVGTINGARIGNSSIDLDKLSQEVPTKEYLDSVEKKLQEEIDGAIETFTVNEIPTLNNEPAVNWTTDDIKSAHVGDLCYVVNGSSDNDGFCYRFQYNGTAYSWALIKDNDVTKAIQDIAELGGEVTQFKSDYTSKVSEIDGGIESLKSRTTAIETSVSTKVETSVFNTLKNTVDENSANITSLAETVTTKADNSTVTTLSNTVNEVKQTADANSSSISSLAATVNTKADGSKVTELETKASTIEQNLNGVTTKVTNLESVSEGLDTRLTTAEANITVTSDAITSKVSKNEVISAINQTAESISIDAGKINLRGAVTFSSFDSSLQSTINNKAETSDLENVRTTATNAQTSINNLEIGGRNLIVERNTSNGWVNSSGTITNSSGYIATDYIPVTPGDTITFQLWTPSSKNSWIDDTYFDSDKNYVTGYNGEYINSNHIIKLYTVPSGASYVRISYSWADGYKAKLEKGNKPTDWSPAPEDVDAGIANAAKVATNFMEYNNTNGLIMGNKTSGSWSGYRSQILPGSFNVLDASSTVLASFGPTTVIGEEAKANLHLAFNNLSMVDKDGAKFFEVGDTRNADGIATMKYTTTTSVDSTGSATVTVDSNISSIVSVYADSVQLSSSKYSFSGKTVTINGLTADSKKTIKITYSTTESIIYLTFGERASSGNIGNYSVAEGRDTTASGMGSHAEGSGTTASVYGSHAEGTATTASEYCSHAEGNATTASGIFSHAEGSNTTASGNSSHAGGSATVADGFCMTAIGKYNTLNSGKAFAIGNGAGGTSRSDAFTVDWDGNTVMQGGLTLGTALSIANGGTGATTVAGARNALGLGNTSGAVPVANGGTGRTTHTSNSVLTGNGTSKLHNVASANGALYATSANGAPKFGTLPIAQGGTGATTASNACDNLGIKDYIIEYGDATLSAITVTARWEKWASGKAVMEFKFSGTASAATVWTKPIYYTDYTSFSDVFASIKSGLFIEAPNVTATSNSSQFIGVIPSGITANGIGKLRYLSVNSKSAGTNGAASFRAVGRWK